MECRITSIYRSTPFFAILASIIVTHFQIDGMAGHSIGMGSCPDVTPFKEFEMEKFKGSWFVIQQVSTSSNCLKFNFFEGDDGKMRLTESSQHYILNKVGVDDFSYTGVLTTPESTEPAKMKIKFPLNVAGKSDFIIFGTDYYNYGAIFSCQKILVAHTKSVSIISRTTNIEENILFKIQDQLQGFGIKPKDLSAIDHSNCEESDDEGYKLNIDDKFFGGGSSGTMNETDKKTPFLSVPPNGVARGFGNTKNFGRSPGSGRSRVG